MRRPDPLFDTFASLTSEQLLRVYAAVRAAHGWEQGRVVDYEDCQTLLGNPEKLGIVLAGSAADGKKFPDDFSFLEKKAIGIQARMDLWDKPYNIDRVREQCHRIAQDPALVTAAITDKATNEQAMSGRGMKL